MKLSFVSDFVKAPPSGRVENGPRPCLQLKREAIACEIPDCVITPSLDERFEVQRESVSSGALFPPSHSAPDSSVYGSENRLNRPQAYQIGAVSAFSHVCIFAARYWA